MELADPGLAKSDSEAIYLLLKRQYQLNEKWIMEIIKLHCPTKEKEVLTHLNNLSKLSNGIISYEEGIKNIKLN